MLKFSRSNCIYIHSFKKQYVHKILVVKNIILCFTLYFFQTKMLGNYTNERDLFDTLSLIVISNSKTLTKVCKISLSCYKTYGTNQGKCTPNTNTPTSIDWKLQIRTDIPKTICPNHLMKVIKTDLLPKVFFTYHFMSIIV